MTTVNVGDTVDFCGNNARPYETTGIVTGTLKYPYIKVRWGSRDTANYLHVSQVKKRA